MAAASSPRALVSLAEAAARYDVNPRTVRRRIADGTITGYRVGRLVRVDLAELDRALVRPIPAVSRAGGAAAC